jgi:large subunit ribosomal protein L29
MKAQELRELNTEELRQRLQALKKELFDLRMEKAVGKLSKPHRFQLLRRDVARILTILRERDRLEPPADSVEGAVAHG